jgi:hypothetical protein
MLGHCDTVDFLSHCWNPQSIILRMKLTNMDDDFNIDEYLMMALEEKAAELEITVDYYMEEFL